MTLPNIILPFTYNFYMYHYITTIAPYYSASYLIYLISLLFKVKILDS